MYLSVKYLCYSNNIILDFIRINIYQFEINIFIKKYIKIVFKNINKNQ